MSKRPGAGGNIGGRRRADLVAQGFDLYGWRCACCGSGDVAVAQHAARSCSAETCGMCRWLRDDGLPGGFQILCLSCKGTGERCTLAHTGGKKRCCACNEIKLPEKEFGTDRTARDGHARAARCAMPQPGQ
ncbi:MAG: hypothetical protein ACRDOI_10395 [Trebonia sp.]